MFLFRRSRTRCECYASVTACPAPVRWRHAGAPCRRSATSATDWGRSSTARRRWSSVASGRVASSSRRTSSSSRTPTPTSSTWTSRPTSVTGTRGPGRWGRRDVPAARPRPRSMDANWCAAGGGFIHGGKTLRNAATASFIGAVRLSVRSAWERLEEYVCRWVLAVGSRSSWVYEGCTMGWGVHVLRSAVLRGWGVLAVLWVAKLFVVRLSKRRIHCSKLDNLSDIFVTYRKDLLQFFKFSLVNEFCLWIVLVEY